MASAKKCIAEKCKDCIYDSTEPGSWRYQIEQCTSTSCALFELRPMTTATAKAERISRSKIIETVEIE